MKKFLILAVFMMIVLSACSSNIIETIEENDPNQQTQENSKFEANNIKLYLIALDDSDLANSLTTSLVGCNDKLATVDTNRFMSATEALEQLFIYSENVAYYNVFKHSVLDIEKIEINEGEAFVYLSGELLIGGMCDTPRVIVSIENTLLQYDDIDRVQIFINDETMESFLSEEG